MSEPNWPEHHGMLSRRALIRAAGLATGGALLLGLPRFVHHLADEAQAADLSTYSSSTNLALELDGQPVCPLRSAQGGNAVALIADEDVIGNFQKKRVSGFQFEDIRVEAPFDTGAVPFLKLIADTLTKAPVPRNGAIVYTDLNYNVVKRLEFTNAYLTKISFPTADATVTTAPGTVSLQFTPQGTRLVGGTGQAYKLSLGTKSKTVLPGLFRLNIQGLEKACGRIAKVEQIQATRRLHIFDPAYTQTQTKTPVSPFSCSQISILLPEADGGPFYAWFDEMVLKGNTGGERVGLLEWLDPTFKIILTKVQLGGLGIVRYAPVPVAVGTEGIAKVQIDLYCESITLLT